MTKLISENVCDKNFYNFVLIIKKKKLNFLAAVGFVSRYCVGFEAKQYTVKPAVSVHGWLSVLVCDSFVTKGCFFLDVIRASYTKECFTYLARIIKFMYIHKHLYFK